MFKGLLLWSGGGIFSRISKTRTGPVTDTFDNELLDDLPANATLVNTTGLLNTTLFNTTFADVSSLFNKTANLTANLLNSTLNLFNQESDTSEESDFDDSAISNLTSLFSANVTADNATLSLEGANVTDGAINTTLLDYNTTLMGFNTTLEGYNTTGKPYNTTDEDLNTETAVNSTSEVEPNESVQDQAELEEAKLSSRNETEEAVADVAMLEDDIIEQDEQKAVDDMFQNLLDVENTLRAVNEKAARHLNPTVAKFRENTADAFNQTHSRINEGLRQLTGSYSPMASTAIAYLLLLLPLGLVGWGSVRIRAMLTLTKVLFAANLYLAAYCFLLALATPFLGGEPMAIFQKSSEDNYTFFQLLQALGFSFFTVGSLIGFLQSLRGEEVIPKLAALVQVLGAVAMGLHYYATVFVPAMLDKPPRTSWRVYLVYCVVFLLMCGFTRLRRTRREILAAEGAEYKQL